MRALFITILFIEAVSTYRYLIYNPIFGHSHSTFTGKIADALTDAGHDVTILSPIFEPLLADHKYANNKSKVIKLETDPRVMTMVEDSRNGLFKDLWTVDPTPVGMFGMAMNFSIMFGYGCEHLMNQDALLNQLREEKFDVTIVEVFYSCGFGVAEILDIKTVISAFSGVNLDTISWYVGEPSAHSYVPSIASTTDEMNIFERLGNFLGGIVGFYTFENIFSTETEIIKKKFGDKYSGHGEALGKVTYNFVNSNPYLDFPRPVIAKTVQIGGITVDTENVDRLDKKWDSILNERKQNVFISFGSVAKSKDMPQKFKDQLLKVFESMPDVTFIWKYEEASNLADHLANVYLEPWLPQKSLIADPRLSAFVTHGGLGSTTEVASFGKPAVMVPLFAEQPRNAAMLKRHGCAVVLQKEDLGDSNIIRNAIKTILEDDQYTISAKRLSEMLLEQPTSARDLVVKHAEFAAKFGPLPHLEPFGRHLYTVQYYLLDAFVLVFLSISTIFTLSVLCIKRYCCSKKQKAE